MPHLSAVIITRDAASQLEACLRSVRFADEILVMDSGSTDRTIEIARAHGAKVVRQEWLGYGAQKRRAAETAAHDWVLSLDADERLSERLRESIEAELQDPRATAYEMARCNRFMGRWLRHGEGYPDWSLRLFDRRQARWSDDPVHEKVIARGPVARLGGDLLHESAESLPAYIEKQRRYIALAAERMRGRSRMLAALQMVGSPLVRFAKFYVLKLGFLDGVPGLVHIAIGCWTSGAKYARFAFMTLR